MQRVCMLVLALLLCVHAARLDLTDVEEDGIQADGEFLVADTENWQAGKSLFDAMDYLFVHKVGADVTFTVTDEDGPSQGVPIEFKAHKTILTARSALMADLLKPAASSLDPVAVTGTDPEAFRQMLRYMYTDKPQLTPNNVLYVASAARVFEMPGLQHLCGEFLQKDLTTKTVFNIMKHGVYFNDQGLISKCLEVIDTAGTGLLTSPDFLDITPEMLAYIVDIEKINCYEVELFQACVRWAEAECGRQNCSTDTTAAIRGILQPLLHKIRFPAMSLKAFTQNVAGSGLLTAEEVATVYQQIISDTPPLATPFISNNRGKPVLYPGDLRLYGSVSTQTSSNSYLTYGIQCLVTANITLLQIHTFKFDSRRGRVYIKQNSRDLYNEELSRATIQSDTIDGQNVQSLILKSAVQVDQGNFEVRLYELYNRNYRAILTYSPSWQRVNDGSMEWWFHSSGSPFLGLQYKIQNGN